MDIVRKFFSQKLQQQSVENNGKTSNGTVPTVDVPAEFNGKNVLPGKGQKASIFLGVSGKAIKNEPSHPAKTNGPVEISSTAQVQKDARRPISVSVAKEFVSLGLKKPVAEIEISEKEEWEHSITNKVYGGPQLFEAKVGDDYFIVRTVDKTIDRASCQGSLDGAFDDKRMQLIKDTQVKLDTAKSGIVLAYPFRFAAFNPVTGKVRLLDSPSGMKKDEIQMQLTRRTSGKQLLELRQTNQENIDQSMKALHNGKKADKSTETFFNLGFLVGKGAANLHKTGNGAPTTHGDARARNVFVNLEDGTITFIDLDQMGSGNSVLAELKLLGFDFARYEMHNIPYIMGFFSGYQSTSAKIPMFQNYPANMEEYLIHNIFYRNFLRSEEFGTFFDPNWNQELYSENIKFKDSDTELFDAVAKAIGISGGPMNFDKFAEVMKIIEIAQMREVIRRTGKQLFVVQVPEGDWREELGSLLKA